MEADRERLADTRDWLVKAARDLRAAEVLMAGSEPLADTAAFHAQQAAEKSLKAFLHWHDVPFRKTHELEELGRACTELDASLENVVDPVLDLTPFAWRFRYPGEPSLPGVDEVKDALGRARAVHDAVRERLPSGARPG
ncbi:MAG: HEPN domain-containing protein [Thermoleophilaceae bacterium]